MNDRTPSTRNRDSGRLSDRGRQKLWKTIEEKLNPYGDKSPTAEAIYNFVEKSPKKQKGVGIDLIGDFISPTPRQDRDFTKATILFACFGLEIDRTNDWIAKQPSSNPPRSSIDWREICNQQLAAQKKLTFTAFLSHTGKAFRVDDVHTPLSLIERKKTPQIKQDFRPESREEAEYTETQKFNHDEFLAQILARTDKTIAMIGEPGAGKTTLLTKIADRVLSTEGEIAAYPIWIPLSALKGRNIRDYLREEWLENALGKTTPTTETKIQELDNLINTGKVWLLLDGVDEMGDNPLLTLSENLNPNWLNKVRVVLTCRVNVWDGSGRNPVWDRCQIFKLKEFEYRDDRGIDRVAEFIGKWFQDTPDRGEKLGRALEEPQRDRIKDVARNPLRLSMLCLTWELGAENLPDTKAELYRLFVDRFYEWKQDIFPTTSHQRRALDRALGELARLSLDRAEYRFRLGKRAIESIWGEQTEDRLNRAKMIGWLNLIGLDGNEEVYAFYHSTFQEYFAACSINDWDYFLPRAHLDRPVAGKQYRIFEPQWREPILLWLGREDISKDEKEELIDKLVDFDDGCEEFYSHHAFFVAAMGIGEFKDSKSAREIVKRLIDLIHGDIHYEIISSAQEIILLTHRQHAIRALIKVFQTVDDRDFLDCVAKILKKIAIDKSKGANVLIEIIQQSEDICLQRLSADILRTIAVGDPAVIVAALAIFTTNDERDHRLLAGWILHVIAFKNSSVILASIEIIHKTINDHLRWDTINILDIIDPGNTEVITALVNIVQKSSTLFLSQAINRLSEVANNNKIAIAALIDLVRTNEFDSFRYQAVESLGRISVNNQEDTIALLTQIIKTDNNHCLRWKSADILWNIDNGNVNAIDTLIDIIQINGEDSLKLWAAESLLKIDKDNSLAMIAVIDIFKANNTSLQLDAINILQKNANGNLIAISTAIYLLSKSNDKHIKQRAANLLGKIGVGNADAIATLVDLVTKDINSHDESFITIDCLLKIDHGNSCVIPSLLEIVVTTNDIEIWQWAVDSLFTIEGGNNHAVKTLFAILKAHDNEYIQLQSAKTLLKINPDKKLNIFTFLIERFLNTENYYIQWRIVHDLGEIASGDIGIIRFLIEILLTVDILDLQRKILQSLGKIAVGNIDTVSTLIRVLNTSNNEELRGSVINSLEKIIVREFIPALIYSIKPTFQHHYSFELLWKYAQTLSYRDFYTAWHTPTPTEPKIQG